MKNKVAMIVGNNFEEIEMTTTIDVLRRAGVDVEIVSLFNQDVLIGSHKIKVLSDLKYRDFKSTEYNGIIIPGGPGVDSQQQPLIDQEQLVNLVQEFNNQKLLVAAICAAPQILGKAQILKGIKITHFPQANKYLNDVETDLSKQSIVDKNIITGRSAGSAVEFALNIVEYLTNKTTRNTVEEQLVI